MRKKTSHRASMAVLAAIVAISCGAAGVKAETAEDLSVYDDMPEPPPGESWDTAVEDTMDAAPGESSDVAAGAVMQLKNVIIDEGIYSEPEILSYSYAYDEKKLSISDSGWSCYNEGVKVPLAPNAMTNENPELIVAGGNEEIQFMHCPAILDGTITTIKAYTGNYALIYHFQVEDGRLVTFSKDICYDMSGSVPTYTLNMDYYYDDAGKLTGIYCTNPPGYEFDVPNYCDYTFIYNADGDLTAYAQSFGGGDPGDAGTDGDFMVSVLDGKIDQIIKEPYYTYSISYDGGRVACKRYNSNQTDGSSVPINYEYDENGYLICQGELDENTNEYRRKVTYEYVVKEEPVPPRALEQTAEGYLSGLYEFSHHDGDVPDGVNSLGGTWNGKYGYNFRPDGTVLYGFDFNVYTDTYSLADEQTPFPLDPEGDYTLYIIHHQDENLGDVKMWISGEEAYLDCSKIDQDFYGGKVYYECFARTEDSTITAPVKDEATGEYSVGNEFENNSFKVTADKVEVQTDDNGMNWIWLYYTVTNKTGFVEVDSRWVSAAFEQNGEVISAEGYEPKWTSVQYLTLDDANPVNGLDPNGGSWQYIAYAPLLDENAPFTANIVSKDWKNAEFYGKTIATLRGDVR